MQPHLAFGFTIIELLIWLFAINSMGEVEAKMASAVGEEKLELVNVFNVSCLLGTYLLQIEVTSQRNQKMARSLKNMF